LAWPNWSLVVRKDKLTVLGPGLGLDGHVLDNRNFLCAQTQRGCLAGFLSETLVFLTVQQMLYLYVNRKF